MTEAGQRLFNEALKLSPTERAQLVLRLAESLDGPFDEESEAAWAQLISRRVAEVKAGTAKLVSAEDAIANARERIKQP